MSLLYFAKMYLSFILMHGSEHVNTSLATVPVCLLCTVKGCFLMSDFYLCKRLLWERGWISLTSSAFPFPGCWWDLAHPQHHLCALRKDSGDRSMGSSKSLDLAVVASSSSPSPACSWNQFSSLYLGGCSLGRTATGQICFSELYLKPVMCPVELESQLYFWRLCVIFGM